MDRYGINRRYVNNGVLLLIVAPGVGIALYYLISLVILPLTASYSAAEGSGGGGTTSSSSSYKPHIYGFFSILFILGIDIAINRRFDVIFTNQFLYTYIAAYAVYGIYTIVSLLLGSSLYSTTHTNSYEPFADVNKTLQQVQQATNSLQNSLSILNTATDDTCSVVKGIEQKYIDNATAPSGDGETPPSPAEAKEMKAKALPGAMKKWSQEKQDWANTHGKTPIVECFSDESLSNLISANQQLSDLLESAPVQTVVAKVKSLQTSNAFAQKYLNELAAKLSGESFVNPTPTMEDTIATSNKLIKRANEIESKMKGIIESSKELKKNYVAMNSKANDPNTVNNLAAKKV